MSAVSYNVSVDQDQVRVTVSLFEFVGGNSQDALRIAINRAGPKVKTAASRRIREQVNLKAAYVNERLTFTRATKARLTGAIKTPSRGLLLSRFATEPGIADESISWIKPPPAPYGGHYVKIKPDQPEVKVGRGSDSKPFYLVQKNSRALAIARRRADNTIDVLRGPSLSQVFNTVRGDVLPQAGEALQDELLDATRYLLAKQYPPEE